MRTKLKKNYPHIIKTAIKIMTYWGKGLLNRTFIQGEIVFLLLVIILAKTYLKTEYIKWLKFAKNNCVHKIIVC